MEDIQVIKSSSESELGSSVQVNRKNVILLISCVLFGIATDFLFFKKPLGISYPIFVLAFYTVFIGNLRKSISFDFSIKWLLSIPVILLSFTYLFFSNEILLALNFMAIPILVVAQTILIARGNANEWYTAAFIIDVLYGFFYRVFVYVVKPFVLLRALFNSRRGAKTHGVMGRVLIGLLFSVPLILVVITLLASADQIFSSYVSSIPEFLNSINFNDFLFQSIFAGLIAVVIFSYIWSFAYPKPNSMENLKRETGTSLRVWDPVIVATVLISVNIIYVAFTLIQFAYLFGGIIPQGFTYAEYARRGFFELNLVTLINLGILLCSVNFIKEGGKGINILTKVLNSLLIACTLVMLLSAHYRMLMYEEAYGYTYLRVFTHWFMGMIFILLAAAAFKVWNEKIRLLKAYIVIILLSYVIVNYANTDVIIAKSNMYRYELTGKLDAYYLGQLSYDAVPVVVPLLNDKNKEIVIDIENSLYEKKERLVKGSGWQGFNLSKYNAGKILSKYNLHYQAKEAGVYER